MIRRKKSGLAHLAIFVLLALGGVVIGACDDKRNEKSDPTATPPASTSAPSAATADVKLPGIDTSPLLPRERKEFNAYVTEFMSPCAEVAVPIAQCITEKRACPSCSTAAKMILKMVRAGYPREEIEKIYKNRFGEAKSIPVDESPTLGLNAAPITVVEFADFECPFCAMEYPVLDRIVTEERKDKVRLVYKIKLLGHPHGEIAARAALAAGNQGKFWEMHHKLFDNQKALEQRDLEGYAKSLGLDMAKFSADMKSKAVTDAIEKDQKLAEGLGIVKTPTIYVNGREIEPDAVGDYVAEELGETPKPKATASVSAGPAFSAAPSASASSSAKPDAGAAKGK